MKIFILKDLDLKKKIYLKHREKINPIVQKRTMITLKVFYIN